MLRVEFSPEARVDLIEIVDYLSEAGLSVARRYEKEIERLIQNLHDLPSTGSPRREYGPNVRVLIVNPYVIFYEDLSERGDISILRILHGHRRVTPKMLFD
jgi:plasmid stabilization system protein ParE